MLSKNGCTDGDDSLASSGNIMNNESPRAYWSDDGAKLESMYGKYPIWDSDRIGAWIEALGNIRLCVHWLSRRT